MQSVSVTKNLKEGVYYIYIFYIYLHTSLITYISRITRFKKCSSRKSLIQTNFFNALKSKLLDDSSFKRKLNYLNKFFI